MITKITGKLVNLTETAAILALNGFEYEVLIPEFVRRQLQPMINSEVSLRTIEFLEGNPQQGRMVPRIVGFTSDAEKEFFDLVCSVNGVGVKKALRAMVRPVREVAAAIEEQDVKQLSTLPGVGPAMAEQIVAKLRRKMAKFALIVAKELPPDQQQDRDLLRDTHDALLSLGHSESDAREKIEAVTQGKKKYKSVDELLRAIYQKQSE